MLRAIWEGCKPEPKAVGERKSYTTDEIRVKAQEMFDNTEPRGRIIPLDRCLDQTVSYFTAWAKRTLDA